MIFDRVKDSQNYKVEPPRHPGNGVSRAENASGTCYGFIGSVANESQWVRRQSYESFQAGVSNIDSPKYNENNGSQ